MIERWQSDIATWLGGSILGCYFALRMTSAALVDGVYTPVGNDSFYHARRILDAAVGNRGFYQFDQMIHVPEGSWLTWPWAFDYFIAKIVSLALLLDPDLAPMTIASHIPLVLQVVTIALLVLVAREIRLHPARSSFSGADILLTVTVAGSAVFRKV
jgi:dolichyl-diphosphooligosaccharide--protein glycosyltransferase